MSGDVYQQRQSAAATFFDVVIQCVMWNVAVQDPFTLLPGRPNHVVSLTGSNIGHVCSELRGGLQQHTISCNDRGRVCQAITLEPFLQLNRVIIVRARLNGRVGRVNDQRSVHPQSLLAVRTRVRVVEVRSPLLHGRFNVENLHAVLNPRDE